MKTRSNFLLLVISTTICLVLAEIVLSYLLPVADPYREIKNRRNQYIRLELPRNFRIETEAEDGLPGMKGKHIFTTNNMGFRGDPLTMPKPKNEFRIFIVGGSTTECFYLDDGEALDAVIQKYLQAHVNPLLVVKVYGAGRSGAASDDHVSIIAHRIVSLKPDMLIVFAGINDLGKSMRGYDYLHFTDLLPTVSALQLFATEFQIPRRLFYFVKNLKPANTDVLSDITAKSNYKPKIDVRKSLPLSDDKPAVDSLAYATNLITICGIAKAHGIKFILMTQPTSWNSPVDPQAKEWHWMLVENGITYREEHMDQAMELMNNTMRKVSAGYGVPLYEIAKELPKSLDFFYDDAHLNVNGASFIGRGLGAFILRSYNEVLPLEPDERQ